MAEEVAIAGSPARAKIREPVAVFLLQFITFGIYGFFWWYYINREVRDLGRARGVAGLGDNPGLSCAAYTLGFLTLYISFVWTIVTTTQRVQRAQRAVGVEPMSGWVTGLLWVFTLGIGGVIYMQSQLNKVWRTQPQALAMAPQALPTQAPNADLDRLKTLSDLKESGAISDEEFEAEKSRILPPQPPPPPPPGAAPLDAPPPHPGQMADDQRPPEQP